MAPYDAQTIAAIHEALDDEYRARAVYAAVIARFGAVRPFTAIIEAEDRHAQALERLLRAAGLPVPPDRWTGQVDAPASLAEALAVGVQAEIDNRAMYDRLAAATSAPEVLRVFANLRRASQENHLPAFSRRLNALRAATDDAVPSSSSATRAAGRSSAEHSPAEHSPIGRAKGGWRAASPDVVSAAPSRPGMGCGSGQGHRHGWR